jgi:hypothetical protein
MQLDTGTLSAIGSTLLTVGGGAVATIKFLFSRFESQINERIEAMETQITKLEGHVEECNRDRTHLRQELIDAIRGRKFEAPPPA